MSAEPSPFSPIQALPHRSPFQGLADVPYPKTPSLTLCSPPFIIPAEHVTAELLVVTYLIAASLAVNSVRTGT